MTNQINICTFQESTLWDKKVTDFGGSVYHLFAWSKIYQQSYGFRPEYLFVQQNNRVVGLIPLIHRGNFFEKLVSLPFGDFAGPLGSEVVSKQIIKYLQSKKMLYEIYSPKNFPSFKGAVVFEDYVLRTDHDYELIRKNYYHHKTRNVVAKTEHLGIRTSVIEINSRNINHFYGLYLATMKRIGTLALSITLFQSVAKHLGAVCLLFASQYQDKVVSFLWCFRYHDNLYIWSNAAREDSLTLGANYAVYDAAIRHACVNELSIVHFGGTGLNSSQAFFKQRWGAKPIPVFLYSNNPSYPQQRWDLLKHSKIIFSHIPLPAYKVISDFALKNL